MKSIYVSAISVALVGFATSAAFAFTPQYCNNYARAAVHEFYYTTTAPNCAVAQTARWQPNFAPHYQWCLSTDFADARREWNIRINFLNGCGAACPGGRCDR
jgi:hypothetical protein